MNMEMNYSVVRTEVKVADLFTAKRDQAEENTALAVFLEERWARDFVMLLQVQAEIDQGCHWQQDNDFLWHTTEPVNGLGVLLRVVPVEV